MPRAATTLDPFNAIAEPKRRQVLDALTKAVGGGECPVTYIVKSLGWPQPQVSKHLAVLRQVGLVSVRRQGRMQMYQVNGERLRPIYEWAKTYERFWTHQLDRIKARAERVARERPEKPKPDSQEKRT
jgi:DNA-binding transcriptional ArsR family regulator